MGFTCIARDGLGDHQATIVQAMAWFRGRLWVGTGGRSLNPMGLGAAGLARMGPLADLLRERDRLRGRAPVGARIWAFDPASGDWERVFASPLEPGPDGAPVPRDRNVRGAIVLDGALWMGASSMRGQVTLLRSVDGHAFEEVPHGHFGLGPQADIPSLRRFVAAGGRLHTAFVGRNQGRGMLDDNMSDFPAVQASDDPLNGGWRAVGEPGFGDPANLSVNELAEFAGHLYAGTLNPRGGFQLWKAEPGAYRWRKILDRGAFAGPVASIAAAMIPFGDHLYVASGLQRQGRGGLDRLGPMPGELLRVAADDSWELVMGEPRVTPHGLKRPISGLGAGFGSVFNRGVWCLAEHDGLLYAGCGDIRVFDTFIPDAKSGLSAGFRARMAEARANWPGGFALWRSADGARWEPVTTQGFEADRHTYGIRELAATPAGLFVGTAASGAGFQVWRSGRP